MCSSSMNSTTSPCAASISFSTAFRRSSNSPRYFDAATIAPRSSDSSFLFFSASGTSPLTMRMRQALDDGGLADAGLADQHGIVLGAAGQHLDGAADFLVPADHRVQLAVARQLGDVARVFLQRIEVRLGVGRVDLAALADVGRPPSPAPAAWPRRPSARARPACPTRQAPPAAGPARRTRRRPWSRLAPRRPARAPVPG